ncbi:hypothetical protein SKAU_G00312630 [Synaphobranchus kaupii]|uniref:PH domain-containing protein n=1 Tax=Synaphobranchus kaupii TaxID=118154 RepID=A0A9Q1ES63_SYNKA|nr:hypothetical protein SKAU_G00312630 [Synaphobranchus kaupii]
MEDGVTGATPAFTAKAGWVKKSSGKLLGSYKERYIKVEKTDMVVFKKQESQNCLERVDLEKYDRCIESRTTFRKKNRLALIRARKHGSKVHDVKLQVKNVEEKEAWMKALNDAINRAKNKIFDEVKVDESRSLDHVTRSRPRGNRSRRPPTRIHMKEVASASSDGILRLDLDVAEHTPNGTHEVSAATFELSDTKSDPVPKPPMPPSQPSEALQEMPSEEDITNPTPVLKESKSRVLGEEDTPAGTTAGSGSEPVSPEKPTGTEDCEEDHPSELPSEAECSTSKQVMGKEGFSPTPSDTPITPPEDMPTSPVLHQHESDQPTPQQKGLFEQEVSSPVLNAPEPPVSISCRAEGQFVITKPSEYSQELSPELLPELSPESLPEPPPEPSPEPAPECPGLPAPPNMMSLKVLAVSDQSCDHWEGSVHDQASLEDTVTPIDVGVSVRWGAELPAELRNERLGGLSEETGSSPSMGQEDVKSDDSGQRSHDEADSCASLEEGVAGRDSPTAKRSTQPPLPVSTPVVDLLSSEEEQRPDVDELRSRIAHELQTTQELLGEVCQGEGRGLAPENLLIRAGEKLQLAQLCLREARVFKLCELPSKKDKRTSW